MRVWYLSAQKGKNESAGTGELPGSATPNSPDDGSYVKIDLLSCFELVLKAIQSLEMALN